MSYQNQQRPPYHGGGNRRGRRGNFYQAPPQTIDARAPEAQPQNNKGADPASGQIRAGWGWGASPETASDEIKAGWGRGGSPAPAPKPGATDAASDASDAPPDGQGQPAMPSPSPVTSPNAPQYSGGIPNFMRSVWQQTAPGAPATGAGVADFTKPLPTALLDRIAQQTDPVRLKINGGGGRIYFGPTPL